MQSNQYLHKKLQKSNSLQHVVQHKRRAKKFSTRVYESTKEKHSSSDSMHAQQPPNNGIYIGQLLNIIFVNQFLCMHDIGDQL